MPVMVMLRDFCRRNWSSEKVKLKYQEYCGFFNGKITIHFGNVYLMCICHFDVHFNCKFWWKTNYFDGFYIVNSATRWPENRVFTVTSSYKNRATWSVYAHFALQNRSRKTTVSFINLKRFYRATSSINTFVAVAVSAWTLFRAIFVAR